MNTIENHRRYAVEGMLIEHQKKIKKDQAEMDKIEEE